MSQMKRIMVIGITAWAIGGFSGMGRLAEAGYRRQYPRIGQMPAEYLQTLAALSNVNVQVRGVQVTVRDLANLPPYERVSLVQAAEQMYLATRVIEAQLEALKASSEQDPAIRIREMQKSRSMTAQVSGALSWVQLPASDAALRNLAAALERIANSYRAPLN